MNAKNKNIKNNQLLVVNDNRDYKNCQYILSSYLNPVHRMEWVADSGVDETLTRENVFSLDGAKEINQLLKWESYHGKSGWYVRSVDVQTGQYRDFGQFKPNEPILGKDGKPQKYFSFPKGSESEAIFLNVGIPLWWEKISKLTGIPVSASDVDRRRVDCGFWQWVINHPEIPLVITEGAKKAGCLLTQGYVAICLTGVWNGQVDKKELIPSLKPFIVPGRRVQLAFDADIVTKPEVRQALKCICGLLQKAGATVDVVTWDIKLGKGCDDFIVSRGTDEFEQVMKDAVAYSKWAKGLEQQFNEPKESGSATRQIATSQDVALSIVEQYKTLWAYHDEQKTWRVFNGKIWKAVSSGAFGQMVLRAIQARNINYKTARFIDDVIKLLEHELLASNWVTFDRKEWIAFDNGILELATSKLHDYEPGFRFTSCLERDYQPLANLRLERNIIDCLQESCPSFYKWAMEAMDSDERRVIKLLAIVNGVIKFRFHDLQMFVHLVGKPGTGKGTFLRLLQNLVGKANRASTQLGELSNNHERARIINTQLVTCPDEDKQVGKHGALKALTGGDNVSFRQLYKEGSDSPFYGTIVVASNFPIFVGDTTGLDRRLCLVSFQNSISAIRRNPEVERLLESELTALTSVALSMTDAEVTQTLKGIDAAEIPELKRQEWEMKVESDSIAAFINEKVIHDVNAKIAVGNGGDPDTVYGAYSNFCKDGGLKPFSLSSFSNKLLTLCNDYLGWSDVSKSRISSGVVINGLRLRKAGFDDDIPFYDETLNAGKVFDTQLKSFEPQPYTPTQPIQGKDFNPTSNPTYPTQSGDVALTSQLSLLTNDSSNPDGSNDVGLSLHSVDPNVGLKHRQGKGCVGYVGLNETFKNSDKSDELPLTSGSSTTNEQAITDEPLKVGDKVTWVKCPGHLENWQPFTIVSINDDLVMLDCIVNPVALPELRRNL